MNENQTSQAHIALSDEVKIEIIHSVKDVLIRLIDTLFPRKLYSDEE